MKTREIPLRQIKAREEAARQERNFYDNCQKAITFAGLLVINLLNRVEPDFLRQIDRIHDK